MTQRPYLRFSGDQLEELLYQSEFDAEVLAALEVELLFRRTRKAQYLLPLVRERLNRIADPAYPADHVPTSIETDDTEAVSAQPDEAEANAEPSSIAHLLPVDTQSLYPESSHIRWDKHQRTVIEYPQYELSIIEAGPGCGKTAVACARVARLVEDYGIPSENILLLSFTRAAVRELRNRIVNAAEDPDSVAGVNIFTLDSMTWHVIHGLHDFEPRSAGYDENIECLLEWMQDPSDELLEEFEKYEHVLVDESQDIVGARAQLIESMLSLLDEECGVTVFSDSAQAIYGFTDDGDDPAANRGTLIDSINSGRCGAFSRSVLDRVHRTDSTELVQLFRSGRQRLLEARSGSEERWHAMRALICQHAEQVAALNEDSALAGQSGSLLILYRSRNEILQRSSFMWSNNIPHRIRMSERPRTVQPWIARVLRECRNERMSQAQFYRQAREELGDACGIAWSLLAECYGDAQERLSLPHLRRSLGQKKPPEQFVEVDEQFDGPILSTIHASKGREADTVHLFLRQDIAERQGDPEDGQYYLEEEKVLFVGATRARKALMVADAKPLYGFDSADSGRRFHRCQKRKCKGRAQIEIGLDGDVVPFPDAQFEAGQEWLWQTCGHYPELHAEYDGEERTYLLRNEQGLVVGALSNLVQRDLWRIGKKAYHSGRPGGRIYRLRMASVCTFVIPEAERQYYPSPWRESGLVLAPVISAFPVVPYF